MTPVRYHGYFSPIFGDSLYGMDRITPHWKANSIYYLMDSSNSHLFHSTNWYFDCGTEDFLFPSNLAMHNFFNDLGIPHEFHYRHGQHNWEYWHKSFILAMVYWGRILKE